MFEYRLKMLLTEAGRERKKYKTNNPSDYYNEKFPSLTQFITNALKTSPAFLRNSNAKKIADHMEDILPFIVDSNTKILRDECLVNQPNFIIGFLRGLEDYPYKEHLHVLYMDLLKDTRDSLLDKRFFDSYISLELGNVFYSYMLNNLSEENQKLFLNKLIDSNVSFNYSSVNYLGDNIQDVYNRISELINTGDYYLLKLFVKEDPDSLKKVKEYIDSHPDEAINSILIQTSSFAKVTDPGLREVIKLIILDVAREEKFKLSEIEFSAGEYSKVLFVGDKVIKLGSRFKKQFPNNPYILSPLMRKDLNINGESCFVEVTESVDTETEIDKEDLYELYKNIRDLGLVWLDVDYRNAGYLKKDNKIHWDEEIAPSDKLLELGEKRGNIILKKGELVVLDSDYIFEEKELRRRDIIPPGAFYREFETRYHMEKEIIVDDDNKKVGLR